MFAWFDVMMGPIWPNALSIPKLNQVGCTLSIRVNKIKKQLEIIQQASIRQKYIDQAQSLNLNIPSNLPVKDVNNLIIEAWKLGVKTLYYQRSQSVSKEMVTNLVSCSSCEG